MLEIVCSSEYSEKRVSKLDYLSKKCMKEKAVGEARAEGEDVEGGRLSGCSAALSGSL